MNVGNVALVLFVLILLIQFYVYFTVHWIFKKLKALRHELGIETNAGTRARINWLKSTIAQHPVIIRSAVRNVIFLDKLTMGLFLGLILLWVISIAS